MSESDCHGYCDECHKASCGELGDAQAVIERLNATIRTLTADVTAARAERDEAIASRDHTQQWWAVREARLRDLAKEKGIWPEFAAVIANGTAHHFDPPLYAQQMNVLRHERDAARVEIDRLHKALKELLDVAEPGDVSGGALKRYEAATDAASNILADAYADATALDGQ